jgi:hypothetical protein
LELSLPLVTSKTSESQESRPPPRNLRIDVFYNFSSLNGYCPFLQINL